MYKLVKRNNLNEVLDILANTKHVGLDTETYGVSRTDRLFALQLSTGPDVFYFNFHDYLDGTEVLTRQDIFRRLAPTLEDPEKILYIHNAKFDLSKLALEGIRPKGGVHCTQMNERFLYNQYLHYSFDACLKRRGMEKDDAVAAYVKEHKLWTVVRYPDGSSTTRKHYDKVPFHIMFKYGCSDAELVLILGRDQRSKLEQHAFYHNDLELQKVACEMEEIGIACDTDYAQKGLENELKQARDIEYQLTQLAGEPFRNGPIWLRRVFDKYLVSYRTNPETGNPVFDKLALASIEHPIADLIRRYRHHEKYASTYYSTYAKHEVVHAEIKLHGTDTGRFSYAEPNLQNVPKEEEADESVPYPVRGCFKPRTTDHCFVAIDFDQQEFRLMLDYAGEMSLIHDINENGADVHQATADAVGSTRKQAKTLNFMLLYGGGAAKLAKSLGLTLDEGKKKREEYFNKLPSVQKFLSQVIQKSEVVGKIHTWAKRDLHAPPPSWVDGKRVRWDYKMTNHIIQGGCADMMRFAMVQCHDILKSYPESNMLLSIHDELLFEIHRDDLHVISALKAAMESVYRPFNGMKMTAGVEHSWKSWAKVDMIDGPPT